MKRYYYVLKSNENSMFSFLSACKKFKTRTAAINYMFSKLPNHVNLLDERAISKHNIEYICSDYHRFFVERCVA